MITLLENFPDNVLAIRAQGQLTREDYQNHLIPGARKQLEQHDKLRVYYELADLTEIEAGAMWEDFAFAVGHLLRWERIAIVTDISWIRRTVHALQFLMPCPVRIFGGNEVTQAREWITQVANG